MHDRSCTCAGCGATELPPPPDRETRIAQDAAMRFLSRVTLDARRDLHTLTDIIREAMLCATTKS